MKIRPGGYGPPSKGDHIHIHGAVHYVRFTGNETFTTRCGGGFYRGAYVTDEPVNCLLCLGAIE